MVIGTFNVTAWLKYVASVVKLFPLRITEFSVFCEIPEQVDCFNWGEVSCETHITKQKNVKVLARLMSKRGISYKDVSLEEGGDWGPKQVYIIVKFADIVDLGNRLSDL